jgi:hypothetical protein
MSDISADIESFGCRQFTAFMSHKKGDFILPLHRHYFFYNIKQLSLTQEAEFSICTILSYH